MTDRLIAHPNDLEVVSCRQQNTRQMEDRGRHFRATVRSWHTFSHGGLILIRVFDEDLGWGWGVSCPEQGRPWASCGPSHGELGPAQLVEGPAGQVLFPGGSPACGARWAQRGAERGLGEARSRGSGALGR